MSNLAKEMSEDVTADAERVHSGHRAVNCLPWSKGKNFSEHSSVEASFSDYSTQESDQKYDGVFIHHKEESQAASMIMQELEERSPGLKLKLYGDVRSSDIYECIEHVCDHSKTILVLWTPKFEDDKQCMGIIRSTKAHKSFTSVSDFIFIIYGFNGNRKPTRKCITLNDALPVYWSEGDYFYTAMEKRLPHCESRRAGIRDETVLKQPGWPSSVARPQTTSGRLPVVEKELTPVRNGKDDKRSSDSRARAEYFTTEADSCKLVKNPAVADPKICSANKEGFTLARSRYISKAVSRDGSHSDEGEAQDSCGGVPDVRSGKHQPPSLSGGGGGGEEAEGRISKARSALGLQQAEGGAGQPADPGFSAVPPPPGDASSQQGRGREGDSPAEGRQRERPQQPALVDTEPAPRQPRSVQQGAASEMNPGTSVDSVPVSSDLRMNASKSQKTSLDSESLSYVYEDNLNTLAKSPPLNTLATPPPLNTLATPPPLNTLATPPPLNTLATQGDLDTVTSGRGHSPSVANLTSRENQTEELGDSPFFQRKGVSLLNAANNARGNFKATQQRGDQEVLSSSQSGLAADKGQGNIQGPGAGHVLSQTADEDGSWTSAKSWSEETEVKRPHSPGIAGEEGINFDVKSKLNRQIPLTQSCYDDGINVSCEPIYTLSVKSTTAEISRTNDELMSTASIDTHHGENGSLPCVDDDSLDRSLFVDGDDNSPQGDLKALAISLKAAAAVADSDQPKELCSVEATPCSDRTSTDGDSITLSGTEGSPGFEVQNSSGSNGLFQDGQASDQTLLTEGGREGFRMLQYPLPPPPHSILPRNTQPFKIHAAVQVSQACENQSDAESDVVSHRNLFPAGQPDDHQSASVVTRSTVTSRPAFPPGCVFSNMTVFNIAHSEHLYMGTGDCSQTVCLPGLGNTGSDDPPDGHVIAQCSRQSQAALNGFNIAPPRTRERQQAGKTSDASEADLQTDEEKTPSRSLGRGSRLLRCLFCGICKVEKSES